MQYKCLKINNAVRPNGDNVVWESDTKFYTQDELLELLQGALDFSLNDPKLGQIIIAANGIYTNVDVEDLWLYTSFTPIGVISNVETTKFLIMGLYYDYLEDDLTSTASVTWSAAKSFCENYVTEGTNKGDWSLPTIKEIEAALENTAILAKSLETIASLFPALKISHLGDSDVWSIDEGENDTAYVYSFLSGNEMAVEKTDHNAARPYLHITL